MSDENDDSGAGSGSGSFFPLNQLMLSKLHRSVASSRGVVAWWQELTGAPKAETRDYPPKNVVLHISCPFLPIDAMRHISGCLRSLGLAHVDEHTKGKECVERTSLSTIAPSRALFNGYANHACVTVLEKRKKVDLDNISFVLGLFFGQRLLTASRGRGRG